MNEPMMDIELFGGPADGMVLTVPVGAKVWTIPTPLMTPAQFIALESGYPTPESAWPVLEHRYDKTHYIGKRTGASLFTYVGSQKVLR